MGTIECRAIEKPNIKFKCDVLRAHSNMNYLDSHDGKLKPIRPERWEQWNVLAQTLDGARKVAQYHFYQSDPENIIITQYH